MGHGFDYLEDMHLPLTETAIKSLENADYISLHLPALSTGEPLLTADYFRHMKDGVFLINVARGSLIDEHALVAALKDGTVAGAGLDVFSSEPVPLSNPLLDKSLNVITSPHSAPNTKETKQAVGLAVCGNVVDFFNGRTTSDWPDLSTMQW